MKKEENNKVIWETENFMVVATEKPFISREEGGHMMILGKDKFQYDSRLDFTPAEALEQQRLSQMTCKAYKIAMKKRGVEIVRINFFEAGNWAWKKDEEGNIQKAYYHEHIFGRTVDAKKQKFPDAPYLPDRKTGFYDDFKPLNDEDIACIIEEMRILEASEEYNVERWSI